MGSGSDSQINNQKDQGNNFILRFQKKRKSFDLFPNTKSNNNQEYHKNSTSIKYNLIEQQKKLENQLSFINSDIETMKYDNLAISDLRNIKKRE